jgi:hypothetical protein
MAKKLTPEEITQKLIRLNNLEMLHNKVKKRNKKLEDENKAIKEREVINDQRIAELEQKLEAALILISELQEMVFGKKNKNKDKDDDNDSSWLLGNKKPKDKKPRSKDSYGRDVPDKKDITKTEHHNLEVNANGDCCCSDCNTNLKNKKIVMFYEEDIPLSSQEDKMKTVIENHVEKWWCYKCKKWISAIPIPSKRVIIWDKVKIYICYLSILMRLSISQVQYLLRDTFHFKISDWEIRNILQEMSYKFKWEYERIKDRLRRWKWVHLDETWWWSQWLWVMASIDTEDVLYLVSETRWKGNAEKLLWDFFEAIRVSDAYGAYINLVWICQLCWAHPFRYIRTLAQTKTLKKLTKKHCIKSYEQFAEIYEKLRSYLEEDFNEEKRKIQKQELIESLKVFCKPHKKDPKKLMNVKKLLVNRMDEYLTCMNHEWVPSDNNKAERKIRHFVIKRRISFWNNSKDWAKAFGINASVLMTYWKKFNEDIFGQLSLLLA